MKKQSNTTGKKAIAKEPHRVLFPKKLARANAILEKVGVPEKA